ncbi:hypothetical protein Goarm_005166, partial [Gossypium armourianum]|nr:hypothetical protein [Gossypium armourianum]
VCLNKDGSIRSEDAFTAVGGLLHDRNVGWIIGFNRYLGNCTVLDYEIWGIFDGLKLMLDWGFERVLIQTDSTEVVNIIQDGILKGSNFTLERRILLLLKLLSHWSTQYVSRKDNKLAERIVKTVRDRRTGLRLMEDPVQMDSL